MAWGCALAMAMPVEACMTTLSDQKEFSSALARAEIAQVQNVHLHSTVLLLCQGATLGQLPQCISQQSLKLHAKLQGTSFKASRPQATAVP